MNAARMVRRGEFKKLGYAIFGELFHRLRKVPHSAYDDLTRQIPPSPRPIGTGRVPLPVMKADDKQVAARIQAILANIEIDEANGS